MLWNIELSDHLYLLSFAVVMLYVLSSITYSISFSSSQVLSFPTLNSANTVNTVFLLLLMLCYYSFIVDVTHLRFGFYDCFFQIVLCLSTISFLLVSKPLLVVRKTTNFELDLLISLSILGLLLVSFSEDFLTFYLAIELQSLCFYVLATFHKDSEYSTEAGIKYFILGAFSSGLLLFSFAILYLSFGSVSFEHIERMSSMQSSILMVISGVFLSIAMLFKLGAFPFHMWLCDVYDGSNVCITAFFSAVPKVILLGFFIKSLFYPFASDLQVVNIFLLASGLSSVCFASLIALYQKRVKRLVAYSTVSHSGFILLGLCCSTIDSVKSCLVYIVVYILMTLTLFSIMFLSGINNSQQKYIINWSSIYERNFSIALTFAIVLFSIAGIPPLAGFYSKLLILLSLLSHGHVVTGIITVIFSSIACYYYIKLIKLFFFSSGSKSTLWFGVGTRHTEFFIAFASTIIVTFLTRPSFLLNSITIMVVSML